MDKAEYVKAQKQTRKHGCHWPGCEKQTPPAMWGCKEHWFKLPQKLRNSIWREYSPGQEIKGTPTNGYVMVSMAVQEWIKDNHGPAQPEQKDS